MADWLPLYTAAILNTDTAYFDVVLDEAARAIDIGLVEVVGAQGHSEARREIACAAKSLLIMRGEWKELKLARR